MDANGAGMVPRTEPVLPGLDVAVRVGAPPGGAGPVAHAQRLAANQWELCLSAGRGGPEVRARVELDVCGAWLTVASEGRRPVVVRRAGWVDLRGQPPGSPQPWDRVGLGPGDSVVAVADAPVTDEVLMDLLLPHAGGAADAIADEVVRTFAGVDQGVVVIQVPALTKEESLQRVVAATGLAPEHFSEPLHPVGSPAADLWQSRPAPPRQARMQLPPRRTAVPEARSLLRRLLASWRMDELLDGHIELLASELLTNAVLHARTEIRAVIGYDGDAVRFEVHDRSPVLPEPHMADVHDEGGRGLWMVSALADRWAVEPAASGKRIWFEVSA